jgi:hypothetical protein
VTNFEKLKEKNLDEMAFVVGCPDDFDKGFEVPEGCQVFNSLSERPISCIECIKQYLKSEVEE